MVTYCPYCMSQVSPGQSCPNCGADPAGYHPSSHHFPMGHRLQNRYLVGKVLGEGGFGITYLGLDTTLERRVAIKEYFPNVFVYRETSVTLDVTCYEGEKRTLYEKGREQFLQEARVMARFDDFAEIVRVLDFFPANNTAYIVMELLTGDTMRTVLARQGRILAKYLFEIMEPVLRAMNAMHGAGIIHRDISPDNIMLLKNGQVKLLDFGCARDVDKEHTMTVMLKHGYAPIEQYTGYNQGPWTDIYALCAAFYHCLTGQMPPRALERMGSEDPLAPPNRLGAALTPEQEQALMRGLAVEPKNRWQSMAGLYAALYGTVIKDFPWLPKEQKTESSSGPELETEILSEPELGTEILSEPELGTEILSGPELGTEILLESESVTESIQGSELGIGQETVSLFSNLRPEANQKVTPEPERQAAPEPEPGPELQKKSALRPSAQKKMLWGGIAACCLVVIVILGIWAAKHVNSSESPADSKLMLSMSEMLPGADGFIRLDVELPEIYDDGTENFVTEVYEANSGGGYIFMITGNGYGGKGTMKLITSVDPDGNIIETKTLQHSEPAGLGAKTADEAYRAQWIGVNASTVDSVDTIAGATHSSNYYRNSMRSVFKAYAYITGNISGQAGAEQIAREGSIFSAGHYHTVGLKSNGTVVAVGDNTKGQCDVGSWSDIVAVSAGVFHTVGLKSDGTVVAVGLNDAGQCDVHDWVDIVAISAGDIHTVGLKSDGTVVAAGDNIWGLCDEVEKWTDIVAIAAGFDHAVGLKSDGTVVAVGYDMSGQCDVEEWTDIVAIAAGDTLTVGLKSDGTVVKVGDISEWWPYNPFYNPMPRYDDPEKWTDIVSIAVGRYCIVGMKSDGTVVVFGSGSEQINWGEAEKWTDIVTIAAGSYHTVGLKSDGTMVAAGSNYFGQCNVSDWADIRMPD